MWNNFGTYRNEKNCCRESEASVQQKRIVEIIDMWSVLGKLLKLLYNPTCKLLYTYLT